MIKNVALASLVAASAVLAQDSSQLHIDTPNGPVACQPTRITWGGGQPPYYVTILKGGESSGTPLADLTGGTPTSETSLTWWVNLEPGTSITATIKDSTGAQNSAAKVDVASGGNTDCISKPLSVSIAGAMATPSGSSNGETPQATDGGNQQGGGGVGGGNTGGEQQQSQGGAEQQPSATPSGGNEQSAQSQSASATSASESAQSASQSATSAAESQSASGASQSASSAGNVASSAGNVASSASNAAGSATSGAQAAASSATGGSGAAALVPGFVAPALAAVVAAFAL